MRSEAGRHTEGERSDAATASPNPLADELMAIALRLREAAEGPGNSAALTDQRVQSPPRNHLALARKAYALRRKREAIFGNPDLFGEPAWDILLDLFIAQSEGKTVSVSSACIGSATPPTTGLRWLGVLGDEGLIVRENDPADNRRVLVRLTQTGTAAMVRFFSAVD
ncbi:MAG: MarR family transcriptional regulator [Erythrobacter sp.]